MVRLSSHSQPDHQAKLREERDYYRYPQFQKNHFLNKPFFYNQNRQKYAFDVIRSYLPDIFRKIGVRQDSKVLFAPSGTGNCYRNVEKYPCQLFGVDISPEALKKCPPASQLVLGDILYLPYQDNCFDYIFAMSFFHHIYREGFTNYLQEFRRTLKKDGYLIVLEPSMFYPFFWVTQTMRVIVGNISGLVSSERPVNPLTFKKSLLNNGFVLEDIFSASYSHNRFPVCLARFLNAIFLPMRRSWLLRYFGWHVYFVAKNTVSISRNEAGFQSSKKG